MYSQCKRRHRAGNFEYRKGLEVWWNLVKLGLRKLLWLPWLPLKDGSRQKSVAKDVETAQGAGGLRQIGGGLGGWSGPWPVLKTGRVNRSLVISKSSSSNPRLSGDFVSSCCVFSGIQDGSMESALFGRRYADSSWWWMRGANSMWNAQNLTHFMAALWQSILIMLDWHANIRHFSTSCFYQTTMCFLSSWPGLPCEYSFLLATDMTSCHQIARKWLRKRWRKSVVASDIPGFKLYWLYSDHVGVS